MLILTEFIFRVLQLGAGGLLERWTEQYLPLNDKCGKSITVQEAKPFTLESTQGIFFGLFTIIVISNIIFFLECLHLKFYKLKRVRTGMPFSVDAISDFDEGRPW